MGEQQRQKQRLLSVSISGAFTLLGLLAHWTHFAPESIAIALFLMAIISGGWFVAPKAVTAARCLAPDMNLLVTIAVLGAAGIGEWSEGAAVAFLFALSELLESFSVARARRAIQSLLKLSPETALLKNGEIFDEVPVEKVCVDDTIAVRGVFDNLTKFIVWILPTNAGLALVLLAAIIAGVALPLLPTQLLWINMVTAVLLGLTLVFETKESDLMQRPPRDPKKPLLTFPLLMRTGLVTLIPLAGAFGLFAWEHGAEGRNLDEARAAVVNVIVMVQTVYC